MFRLSGLKSVRMRGVWLLATIGFMIVLTVITPSMAAPIETSTTILSDVGAVRVDETIHFTVWVFAGFDPVPTGPVRITDTNTSEYIDSSILGGKIEVNWTVSEPFVEGIHVFEASYQGFQDYSSSSGMCIVHFDNFSLGDSRTTSITLQTNSSVVFKNASIQFTVELTIHYRWLFRGGYIYVRNVNFSGTPTIHTYGPLPNYYPGTDPSVMTYSFDYQIPLFSLVGTNSFIAEYTGSLDSDTLPCTSVLTNVSVMSTGYWLVQNLDKTELQREEETLELNTTVLGDYPVGLKLRSYYYLDQQPVFFDNQTLTSRNASTFFSPNSSVPVGLISITTELIDPSTEFQYANSTEIVSIVDRARVEHTENATEFRHNETIRLEVYITEEDVHTHPVVCDVEFIDVTDGNRSLLNKTTNQDGFVVIEYLIPDNSTVGSHEFSLRTYNSNVFIIDIVETFPITIKGLTDIDLTYASGGVDRNSVTIIEVTVLSGGTAISDGLVSLEFAINDSVIETKACEPGLELNYFLEPAYPRGVMNYQAHFFGSPNYDEQVEPFDLTIFSNPTFNTTGQNASEVIKGHTVRIWGQLVDEIGQPVIYEEVELTDITLGMFLGTSETDDQGIFYYDYLISETTQIGVHFVEIAYLGNIFEFYHQSTNYPVISITVRPPLSVMIGSEVVANHWTIITLEGGLNDEITLEWQKSGETNWIFLDSVVLNSTGQGNYNWSTPYYKGDFTIRAIGPNSSKYDFSSMYAIPMILVSGDALGNVNDLYSFTVNCTEQYQIWIGGQLWHDWQGAGVHQYDYIFSNRGMNEIVIISNETYVYYQEFHYIIAVYEEVTVTISVPLEAPMNVTVNIDGTVNGEVSGPIQAVDAFLVINGTETQVDSTDGGGNFHFSVVFDTPGCYSLQGKTLLDEEDFYFSGYSEESIIQISSIPPNVLLLSPQNQTYGANVEIEITGDAQTYWYRIEPIDMTNQSWNSLVNRILIEGNYTCYVYGENEYGVVTSSYSNFAVDTTPPSLILINPENITYTTNDILLTYSTDGSEVLVFLDDVNLGALSSGTNLVVLEGNHNLTIWTQDIVNNEITTTVIFSVDTVPPILVIDSPLAVIYGTEIINVTLSGNANHFWYHIDPVDSLNQTWITSINRTLSNGTYTLHAYGNDSVGNTFHVSISFTVDLNIIIPTVTIISPLNQTYSGSIMISLNSSCNTTLFYIPEIHTLNQTYTEPVTLNLSSGQYLLHAYAFNEADEVCFKSIEFSVINPPLFESISVKWNSPFYEIRTRVGSGSISKDMINVKVNVNGTSYSLDYDNDPLIKSWTLSLAIPPQNTTFWFSAGYSWDENSSVEDDHQIYWYAPTIINEDFSPQRNNFTIKIRIDEQNESIDTQSVLLFVDNGSINFSDSGILIYESLLGNYQEWYFSVSDLPPSVWDYYIQATDIYGATQIFRGTFNNSDFPPDFGSYSSSLISKYSSGELWRIEVPVSDDFKVDSVFLSVDGVSNSAISQNESHYIFEIWVSEGPHHLQLVAHDDIDQVSVLPLPSINVVIENSSTTPTSTTITTSTLPTSIFIPSNITTQSTTNEGGGTNDLIELGFAGSIFIGLIAAGNLVNRKRVK